MTRWSCKRHCNQLWQCEGESRSAPNLLPDVVQDSNYQLGLVQVDFGTHTSRSYTRTQMGQEFSRLGRQFGVKVQSPHGWLHCGLVLWCGRSSSQMVWMSGQSCAQKPSSSSQLALASVLQIHSLPQPWVIGSLVLVVQEEYTKKWARCELLPDSDPTML